MKRVRLTIFCLLVTLPGVVLGAQDFFGFGAAIGVPKGGLGLVAHRDYEVTDGFFARLELDLGLPLTSVGVGTGLGYRNGAIDMGLFASTRYIFGKWWPLTASNFMLFVGPEVGIQFGPRFAVGYRPLFLAGSWYTQALGTMYVMVEWPGTIEK